MQRDNRFKSEDGNLILSLVKMEDDGQYECSANNEVSTITKLIWIIVNGKIIPFLMK